MNRGEYFSTRWQAWLGGLLIACIGTVGRVHSTGLDTGKAYCAKPLPLSDADNDAINQLTATGTGDQRLWKTRTIPVVLDSSLSEAGKKLLATAAKHISAMSNVTFYVCSADVALSDDQIKGFVAAASFTAAKCPDAIGILGCTKETGFLEKTRQALQKGDNKILSEGLPWAVRYPDDAGTAVHELLHSLGMKHAQQSPAAAQYLAVAPDEGSLAATNCAFDGPKAGVHWIGQYDPASIMHYDIGQNKPICHITMADCTRTKNGGLEQLSKCKIDPLIDKGDPCRYKAGDGKPKTGTKCFKRPTVLIQGTAYGGSDFELSKKTCISVLDQAWLLSAYPLTTTEDLFGLKTGEKCTPL